MKAIPNLLDSKYLASVTKLPSESKASPMRSYEDERADLLNMLMHMKSTYFLGYDVSNLVRNLINELEAEGDE